MPDTTLFALAEPGVAHTRANHRGETAALKKAHGIFTHRASFTTGNWMALSMPECCEALSGYGLTDEEKTNGVALMAGYCRLLDEAGLVEEGHKTEHAAVTALVARIKAQEKSP